MAIPTSRTKESGRVCIDTDRCNGCGTCVEVCKSFMLTLADGKAKVSETSCFFGCCADGHCMAVCPNDAITVHGRTLSPDDLLDLPTVENVTNYSQLLALLQRRRSIREFSDRKVEPEIIEKYGIKFKSQEGIFVIFGYSSVKYQKGLKRTFASVTYQ